MAEHSPGFLKFNNPEENEKIYRRKVLKDLAERGNDFIHGLNFLGTELPNNPTKEEVEGFINEFLKKAEEKLQKINAKNEKTTSGLSELGQQINITPLAGSERSETQRASYYLGTLIDAFKEIQEYIKTTESIDAESVEALIKRNKNNLEFWSKVAPGIELDEPKEKRPFSVTPRNDAEEQRKALKEIMIINACKKFLNRTNHQNNS